jgi:hypothetical protein
MKPFAIELNDRMVCVAREGKVLAGAPATAFDGGGGEPIGSNAWHALHLKPTIISTRYMNDSVAQSSPSQHSLSLLKADLARRLAGNESNDGNEPERVWMVTPAYVDPLGLNAVLDISRGLGLLVDGFVDSAAVTIAALRRERSALVLELGLHHVAVTAVECNGQARRRRSVASTRGGLLELYDHWIALISSAMVKRTRFDPLHNAATEQQIFDALPSLTHDAAASGGATAAVNANEERFEVPLSRDQFAEAAQPIYREILRLLHALRPAGAAVELVMPRAAAELPGMRELLESFVGCTLTVVPDGFAAAATSLLELPAAAGEGETVKLLRRLPAKAQPELQALASREPLGRQHTGAAVTSHVLFEGKAYVLGNLLVVGRELREGKDINYIKLPEGLAGVSRRHCTFLRERGEVVLIDHSSFGTSVNGERVAERVRVQAGDRIKLGDPGVELSLISI